MFKVIAKQNVNRVIRRVDIQADSLASKVRPGHFVALMPDRFSRLVPLVVYEVDWRRKSLALIFREADSETSLLAAKKIGDPVFLLQGPFGTPFLAEKTGTVVCVGEDLGLVPLAGMCRLLKQAGNKVIGVVGFEQRNNALLESQIRLNCSKFFVMYKDGTHERRGDVLAPLNKVLSSEAGVTVYASVSSGMLEDVHQVCQANKAALYIHLMPWLDIAAAFSPAVPIITGKQKYYPAVSGLVVRADRMDVKQLAGFLAGAREYSECRRKDAASWHRPGVFARLKKFVWG